MYQCSVRSEVAALTIKRTLQTVNGLLSIDIFIYKPVVVEVVMPPGNNMTRSLKGQYLRWCQK